LGSESNRHVLSAQNIGCGGHHIALLGKRNDTRAAAEMLADFRELQHGLIDRQESAHDPAIFRGKMVINVVVPEYWVAIRRQTAGDYFHRLCCPLRNVGALIVHPPRRSSTGGYQPKAYGCKQAHRHRPGGGIRPT
jgi:hypothetical protein